MSVQWLEVSRVIQETYPSDNLMDQDNPGLINTYSRSTSSSMS